MDARQLVTIRDAVAALWPASGPLAVERDGMSIVFDERPVIIGANSIDAMVRVFRGAKELRVDPHRICINPPLRVPFGDGYRVDPVAAYLEWVADSLRVAPNPKGWRTRGTVTTVYAGTGDRWIENQSATYATARDGGGTDTSGLSTATLGYVGQDAFGGGPTYGCDQYLCGFDTSAVGTDTVSAVVFSLYGGAGGSLGTNFTVEVRPFDWSAGGATIADWRTAAQLGALTLLASFDTTGWSTSAYNDFTESGTNFQAAINGSGTTYLNVSSSRNRAGTTPTGHEYAEFYQADEAGTTKDPKLVVTHAAAGGKGPLTGKLAGGGILTGRLAQ